MESDKQNFAIESVADFLQRIYEVEKEEDYDIFFRGQTQMSSIDKGVERKWDPSPSIFRENRKEREHDYYSYSMTECASEFSKCNNHCEILSTMQHYGIPTRLMDLTTNALVALFFACVSDDGKINNNNEGVVFVIKAHRNFVKDYDSDTITILSSLPRLASHCKDKIKTLAEEAEQTSVGTEKFNHDKDSVRKLLHEIRREKPAFEAIINPLHVLDNFIFTPQKTNQRIIRQSGAFVIFGLKNEMLFQKQNEDKVGSPIIIDSIMIKKKSKIVRDLESCGISLATMFPELYKVADYLKQSKLKI